MTRSTLVPTGIPGIAAVLFERSATWPGEWLDDLALLADKDGTLRVGSARARTADEQVVITWTDVEALGCETPDELAWHLETTVEGF
jgi:hypothetical protein